MAIVPTHNDSVRARLGTWQEQLKSAIRDPFELCLHLKLPSQIARDAATGSQGFSLFAPLPFVNRIQPGNVDDPLLLQLLPQKSELVESDDYLLDPVNDLSHSIAPGVIQKYAGRALLITTGACAIHCRYCFRRHFPYQEAPAGDQAWQESLRSIAQDDSIKEVILSGGDPLMLNDQSLSRLVEQIEAIPHIRRLRIHTRLPIMIPGRVTDELLTTLSTTRLDVWFVLHSNHANEFDSDVGQAIKKINSLGIPLLNQSVLLKGINDDPDTLVQLSETLIEHKAIPYYLNSLDKVHGAAHFAVPISTGQTIIKHMRERLPGFAVPRFVVDDDQGSKTLLA